MDRERSRPEAAFALLGAAVAAFFVIMRDRQPALKAWDMPRSVMPFAIAATMALAFAAVTARAGDYWGAVSIAPDGGSGVAADYYTAAQAESAAKKGCQLTSDHPDQCLVISVEPGRSAVAWLCLEEGTTEGLALITIAVGLEVDDHKSAMASKARRYGYKPAQCQARMFVTGRFGIRLTDGKKIGTY